MSDIRNELTNLADNAVADVERATRRAEALEEMRGIAWSVEVEGPVLDIDAIERRLNSSDRARWQAALVVAVANEIPNNE